MSIFDCSHNEFWNSWTEILPMLWFMWQIYWVTKTEGFTNAPPAMQCAMWATGASTVFQHLASLLAHLYNCCPRITATVWTLDYAAIGFNFSFNTVAQLLFLFPSVRVYWKPLLFGVMPAFTFFLSFKAIETLREKPGCWQPRSFLRLTEVVCVGNMALTLCLTAVDSRAWLFVAGLPIAVAIWQLSFPESALGDGSCDCSPFHSHVIWHVLVFLLQVIYFEVYRDALYNLSMFGVWPLGAADAIPSSPLW